MPMLHLLLRNHYCLRGCVREQQSHHVSEDTFSAAKAPSCGRGKSDANPAYLHAIGRPLVFGLISKLPLAFAITAIYLDSLGRQFVSIE